MSRDCLLVCNAGSATLKIKIFRLRDLSELVSGQIERLGVPGSALELREHASGRKIWRNFPAGVSSPAAAAREMFGHLRPWAERLRGIAHRVVHGGERFRRPAWLATGVVERLQKLSALAPLHNQHNLAVVAACQDAFRGVPNAAVFDTAYYATLPVESYLYALPYEYYTRYGVRRYGFHGISHQYLAHTAAAQLKRPLTRLRLITAHLGSGCSLTATRFGAAVETTMGFTPLSGLTMGTRSGDLDPAVVTFLQRVGNLSLSQVDDLLNTRSGLLGIFGVSGDLRDVLVAAGYSVTGYTPPNAFRPAERRRAKLALGVFIYNIVRYIGSLATVMGGLDALVFSGAIGQKSAVVRQLVRQRLRPWSKVTTLVIPTAEELMIARLTRGMVRRAQPVASSPAVP